jgi:hypothetical protein
MIARILKTHGVSPVPARPTSWQTFLRAHWEAIAGADFFTTEIWNVAKVSDVLHRVRDRPRILTGIRSSYVNRLASPWRALAPACGWHALTDNVDCDRTVLRDPQNPEEH